MWSHLRHALIKSWSQSKASFDLRWVLKEPLIDWSADIHWAQKLFMIDIEYVIYTQYLWRE